MVVLVVFAGLASVSGVAVSGVVAIGVVEEEELVGVVVVVLEEEEDDDVVVAVVVVVLSAGDAEGGAYSASEHIWGSSASSSLAMLMVHEPVGVLICEYECTIVSMGR